jgi:quercetin dioxygenase-like cupin family protein
MSTQRTAFEGTTPPATVEVEAELRAEGLKPQTWSNGPGVRYGWHEHSYHKRLYCTAGSIVFQTRNGDYELEPGDRLDLTPGTAHAATVGPHGVTCVEATL